MYCVLSLALAAFRPSCPFPAWWSHGSREVETNKASLDASLQSWRRQAAELARTLEEQVPGRGPVASVARTHYVEEHVGVQSIEVEKIRRCILRQLK